MASSVAGPVHRTLNAGRLLGNVVLAVAVLLCLEMAASMLWPLTAPRFGFLPKPAKEEWPVDNGCNTATRYWDEDNKGLFWKPEVFQTLGLCMEDANDNEGYVITG